MWTTKDVPDQTGKIAIVTGANVGIGYETALGLYKAGAHVIMACRNLENAEQARQAIRNTNGAGSVELAFIDLSSLRSVQEFADTFKKNHNKLPCWSIMPEQ